MEEILVDVIRYGRKKIIGNELQFATAFFCNMTAYLQNPDLKISWCLTGSPSSGKSHIQKTVFELFPSEDYVSISSSSSKGILDDEKIRKAKILKVQEIEKIKNNSEIVELVKALSFWDGLRDETGNPIAYEYVRSMKGKKSKRITLPVMVVSLTTAEEEIEPSLLSRLLTIPTDESKDLNRAVALFQLGKKEVEYGGCIYSLASEPVPKEALKINATIRKLKENRDLRVEIPESFPDFLLSFLDLSKTESRRHSKNIRALLEASALANFQNREKDLFDEKVIYASAQDIFNIFLIRKIIFSSIYHLDDVDKVIIEIFRRYEKPAEQEGLTKYDVRKALLSLPQFSSLTPSAIQKRLRNLEALGILEVARVGMRGIYEYTLSDAVEKSKERRELNFDEVLEEDKSEVINPFTLERYENIKEAILKELEKKKKKKVEMSLDSFLKGEEEGG